jgi:O-antigen ligase
MRGGTHPLRTIIAITLLALVGGGAYALILIGQAGDVAAATRAFDIDPSGDRDQARILLWEAALQAFYSSPILGVGLGQYGLWYVSDEGIAMATHNTYLSYLAETGLVGLLFEVAFLYSMFRRTMRADVDDPLRDIMLIYLPAAATQALFNNVDNFRIIWVAFAIVVAVLSTKTRKPLL